MNTLVSVVVTTKNEEKNIRTCLQSICAQTWGEIETIVVDNSSDDATCSIASEFTTNVYTRGPERSAQRNFGMIEKASGDYVIYVDADMILSRTLIEACVRYIGGSEAIALHIPETILGTRYLSKVRRFERGFYDGTVVDGARFFNRSIFSSVGGFDEELFKKGSGEDWDIDKKIKRVGKIDYLPKKFIRSDDIPWPLEDFVRNGGVTYDKDYAGLYHNEEEFRLVPYIKKKAYYSAGFEGYIKKWGVSDPDVARQFGFGYRYWTVFTENGKWKRLMSRLDFAVGMYFLRICVGVVFLMKVFMKFNAAEKINNS